MAVHLASILHASRSLPPPPPPPRRVIAQLLMQSSISGEGRAGSVWAQRSGKSAIHVILMPAVIEGDTVPLGGGGGGGGGDQHAAAVREKSHGRGGRGV